MLLYSERQELVKMYLKFLNDEGEMIKDPEMSFLNFLQANGLLNEDACEAFLDDLVVGEND